MRDVEAATRFTRQSQALIHLLWSALGAVRSAETEYREQRSRADFGRLAGEIAEIAQSCGVEDCVRVTEAAQRAMTQASATPDTQAALAAVAEDVILYLLRRKGAIEEEQAITAPDAETQSVMKDLLRRLRALAGEPPDSEESVGIDSIGDAPMTSEAIGETPSDVEPPTLARVPIAPAATASPPSAAELDHIPTTLRTSFLGEAQDLITELQRIALELERVPGDERLLTAAKRIAHRLRGSAGTVHMRPLAQVAFEFEELLEALRLAGASAGASAGAWGVVATLQCIGLLQRALDQEAGAQPPDPTLVDTAARLRASAMVSGAASVPATAAPSPDPPNGSGPEASEDGRHSQPEADLTLKVDVRHLDELMARVSALTINRTTMAGARDEVSRLQEEMGQALGKLNALAERLQDLRPGGGGGASLPGPSSLPLATLAEMSLPSRERAQQFDDSMRVMREAVDDVTTLDSSLRAVMGQLQRIVEAQEALMSEVQHDVIEMRLVPLDDIVLTLRLAARLLAADLGKAIAFNIRGEATQIDREISDLLKEPLLQLLRNAITHGIEPAKERRAAGKPEEGRVWLEAHYVGNEVSIEIGDDGRGVNLGMLREAAVKAGHLRRDAARQLSNDQALDLMFLPGISTYGQADMVGGRGIGLDEVRETLRRLHGTITVSSASGAGSVFSIRVPISLSITHVLHVSAGDQGYAIPFSFVQRTIALTQEQIRPTGVTSRPYVVALPETGPDESDGDHLTETPAYPLASLLGRAYAMDPARVALIVEHGHERIALLVDAIHEDRELVARSLPPHLRRKVVSGVTTTPDGQILLILDIPALLTRSMHMPPPAPSAQRPPPPRKPRILIVDDSASIRRVLQQDLARAGFAVGVARDGIDALQAMVKEPPQIVILDIEMPRLDGFEFLSALRNSTESPSPRVIMLTSRASEKHQAYARQLGADAYFVKPCPIATLTAKIYELLESPPEKAGALS
jgi:chemosensory pili system protein ChpA (sensor histidine kinase/response regulator)